MQQELQDPERDKRADDIAQHPDRKIAVTYQLRGDRGKQHQQHDRAQPECFHQRRNTAKQIEHPHEVQEGEDRKHSPREQQERWRQALGQYRCQHQVKGKYQQQEGLQADRQRPADVLRHIPKYFARREGRQKHVDHRRH